MSSNLIFFCMLSLLKFHWLIDFKVLSYFFININKDILNYYTYWDTEYSFILIFMVLSFVLTCVLFFLSFLLSTKSVSFEKGSPYECGFEPFSGHAHSIFNIQYFIVGILFMIFDLELCYLFVWVIHLGILSIFSFWIVMFFLILLIIGFVYEWKKGALDWL